MGPNWPYTLVQLNGDTCHVSLPREGPLSKLPEGGTSSAASRRVSQLEVCQLLSSDSQVIYPIGLNGCEIHVITSLPKSLTNGANLLGGEPIYLKVDILQSIVEGPEWKALPSANCPINATLPKVERGQHDHGSEGAPVQGGIRHIWTCIRSLNPKNNKSHGCTHTSACQTRRFSQASGHIIPGEHPG